MKAIYLLRSGCGERMRNTRLDVLPAVGDDGSDEIWLADGDRGEVIARLPAEQLGLLLWTLADAIYRLGQKGPEEQWYGSYPRSAK